MIRVVALKKIAEACPSVWEGRTDAGECVYVRYRWGALTVGVGATLDEAVARGVWDGLGGRTVFACEFGTDLDGWLSFDDLVRVTAGAIAWECEPPPEATKPEVVDAYAKVKGVIDELVEQGKVTVIRLPADPLARAADRIKPPTRPGLDVRCPRCDSLQPVTEVPVPAGQKFRCTCGEDFVYGGVRS